MTLKHADEEQSKLFNVLKDLNRGVKPVEKRAVINNIRLFLTEKEKKYLNSFRTKIFPIKYTRPEQALNPTPEKTTEKTPGPAYEITCVKTPEQHLNKHLNKHLSHYLNQYLIQKYLMQLKQQKRLKEKYL